MAWSRLCGSVVFIRRSRALVCNALLSDAAVAGALDVEMMSRNDGVRVYCSDKEFILVFQGGRGSSSRVVSRRRPHEHLRTTASALER